MTKGRLASWTLLLAGFALLVLLTVSGAHGQSPDPARRALTLTIANTVEVPTFDPHRVLGIDAIVAVGNLYDRLVYLDADGSNKPWLATSWTTSDDGRVWTFQLRRDAKFHDGSPVTSEAVKYSFERAIGQGSPPSLAKTYLSPIETMETPDPFAIKITTKAPFAPLLNHLGHQTAGAILNPAVVKAHNNDLSTAIDAGGGMYKLGSWSRNNELVLVRDDRWWGPRAGFERIVYKPISQISTRVIMLEKGEVDVVTNLPSFEVPRLQKSRALRVTSTESVRSMYFAFNMGSAPVDNLKVRQALNYAVNVDGIIRALLGGHGTPARSVITPNLQFYYPAYDFKYDAAKAKALLKEAGISSGTRVTLVSPKGRWPMDSEIAQAVAGNLRDIALDVDLRIVGDWAQYQQTLRNGDFHLGMFAWAPGSLDADGTFRSVLLSGSPTNYGKYKREAADALITQGARSIDPKVRAIEYQKLQELMGRDVPLLLLHNGVSFSAARTGICGVNVRSDEAIIIKDAKAC